jgi:hypothetical protein
MAPISYEQIEKTYLDTAEVEGAKAETEVAARERAARVRRGAMVEVYLSRLACSEPLTFPS